MSIPRISHLPTSAGEGGSGFVAEVTDLKARHEAECACLTSTMKNRTQRGISTAFEKLAQAHKDRERLLIMVGAYDGRFEGPQAPIVAAIGVVKKGDPVNIPADPDTLPPDDEAPPKTVKKVIKKMVKKANRK